MFFLLALAAVGAATAAKNGCVSFQVAPGTGCAWMCNYCASQVGPNYYFTDGVCSYESSGCMGSPQAGVSYTCCSASAAIEF
jgi:hypothetical protein